MRIVGPASSLYRRLLQHGRAGVAVGGLARPAAAPVAHYMGIRRECGRILRVAKVQGNPRGDVSGKRQTADGVATCRSTWERC